MKKFLSLFLIIATLCACSSSGEAKHGGAPISNQTLGMGLNYSALESGTGNTAGSDYPLVSQADFAYFRSKNIQHIRLPIKWERVQTTLGGALDPTYLGYIDQAVTYAKALGMTISLDVHNFGGYNGQQIGSGVTKEQFADLWSKLATYYINEPTISQYDLMNEPVGFADLQVWPDAAQAAITAIRLVDMNKEIIVEGYFYASAYQWIESNPTLHLIVDPANKLRFSAHCYFDRNNSGTHFIWAEEEAAGDELTDPTSVLDENIGVKRISVFVGWLNQYGFKGDIGEVGFGMNETGWNVAGDKAFQYIFANNLTVTYWASGPFFAAYPYGVQPDGSGYDKKQFAVINKYSGSVNPTNFTLTGPEYGFINTASDPFVINYRGYLKSPLTIVPNDGGQGGTFTPNPVVVPAGVTGEATFTYTPNASKVYAINTTNQFDLTPAPEIDYATTQDLFRQYSVVPTNVFWPTKLRTAYTGAYARLRRVSDNAEKDFGFTSIQLYSPLDTAAISTWTGGANPKIVKLYDQGPKNYYAGPPHSIDGSGDGAPATLADQPELVLNCVNTTKPCIRWNGNRMDTRSPINGRTELTMITAMKPQARTSGRLWAWDLVQNHAFPDTNGDFGLAGTGQPTMLMYPEWGSYAGRWQANLVNGQTTYKNGGIAQRADTTGQGPLQFQFRDVAKRGYFVFAPVYFGGDEYGSVVTDNAAPDGFMSAMNTVIQTEIATPTAPDPFVFPDQPTPTPDSVPVYPLTGVNLSGMEFGGQAFYPTLAEMQYYYARGLRIVRLPFQWERIQPTLGAPLDSGELGRLTTVVNNARASGLAVLLDLHNFGGYNGNPINGAGGPTYAQFADVWSRLATAFLNNPKVSMDLMNEPASVTAAVMGTASQAAITAIRATGFTNEIHVEGGGSYASCQQFVTTGAAAIFTALTDPSNKLIAHCHAYVDSDASGTSDQAATGAGVARLAPIITYCTANNCKFFVGEFGIANTTSMFTENTALLNACSASSTCAGWAHWTGGPAWGESYFYKTDPAGFSPQIYDKPQVPLLYQHRL